jgi:periplasmic copper chaperone A
MRMVFALCALFALAACGAPPSPTEPSGGVEISAAWAAPTPGGVDVSAGYLTIANSTAENDRLVAAASPRAERVEIHEMAMDGAVMRMRRAEALDIPAGEQVALAPGGLHLMFFGVTQPFAEGEEIPVTLTFERAGAVDVTLPVQRGPDAAPAHEMR